MVLFGPRNLSCLSAGLKDGAEDTLFRLGGREGAKVHPSQEDNPYVIAGDIECQHLTDMQKPWRRIRNLADLPDVRIHDLRHTFASSGVALGQGLPVIGRLLGHTQPQTTARYAHLAASPALEVADKISEKLATFIEWKEAS